MSVEWRLEQLGKIITGKTPSGDIDNAYSDYGVPFITPRDMNGQKWVLKTERSLTEVGLDSVKRVLIPTGSVAVSCIGSDMGKVVLTSTESVTNQQINTIIPEQSVCNPGYLYYVLSTMQQELKDIAGGSATPILNKSHFGRVAIQLPDLTEQNAVNNLLSLFDDKIQLNRQINQTLEQMAQAIFQSWFVDFEPVKAKISAREDWLARQAAQSDAHDDAPQFSSPVCYAHEFADAAAPAPATQADLETFMNRAAMCAISGKTDADLDAMPAADYQRLYHTASLFPDELVESELGEIPKGWEVTDFGSVSICFDKYRIPLSKSQREAKSGTIPYYGATSVMDYVDEAIFNGIYLLLGEDGSVLKADGTPFVQYIWGEFWVNNHAHVLQGSNGVSTEQLMIFISQQNITPYVTGAVQLKLNQKNMNSIPFVKAGNAICEEFYKVICPLYEQIRVNTGQNDSLIKMRDSLLPKLLSGELDISALTDLAIDTVVHG